MKYWIMPIIGVVASVALLVYVFASSSDTANMQGLLLIVPAFYLWPTIILTLILLVWHRFKPNDTLKWFASFFGMFAALSLSCLALMLLAVFEMISHVGAF
ncbi:MAG: hypothetical protein OSB62_00105 [Alphaproteobacteria bacterium]|nr:hypothetical protein [Alphaproteobacteria bacterium]